MTPAREKDPATPDHEQATAFEETGRHGAPPPVIAPRSEEPEPTEAPPDETIAVQVEGAPLVADAGAAAPTPQGGAVSPDATVIAPVAPPPAPRAMPPASTEGDAVDPPKTGPSRGTAPPRADATQLASAAPPRLSHGSVAAPAATPHSGDPASAAADVAADLEETVHAEPLVTGPQGPAEAGLPATAPRPPEREPPPEARPDGTRGIDESTQFGAGSAAAVAAASESLGQTLAVGSATVAPMVFERVQPPVFRGEVIALDRARRRYRIGRSERCDIPLYTASASREHADVEVGPDGFWSVAPLAGKRVRVEGREIVVPTRVEAGQVIGFGEDELRLRVADDEPVELDRSRLLLFGAMALGALLMLAGIWLTLSG